MSKNIFGFNDFSKEFDSKVQVVSRTNKNSIPVNTKSNVFGFKDFNTPSKINKAATSPVKTKSNIHGFKNYDDKPIKPVTSPVKTKSNIFEFKNFNTPSKTLKPVNSPVKSIDKEKDQDYLFALQLQIQFQNDATPSKNFKLPSPEKPMRVNLADPEYDLIDPNPDIRALFMEFDKKYFWSTLGSCIVEWSKRMTICAGIFYLRGGGTIRLSEKLLQFRPRKDLVETLLHEMIHAYLYLTRNFKDRDGHGDEFKSHMNRINALACTNITIYHSFHDEVNEARQHVWRCTGVCRTQKPFFGYVKRSMNRAPSKNDRWWADHQSKCQGVFEKVSEPDSFKKKAIKKEEKKESSQVFKTEKAEKSVKKEISVKTGLSIEAYFKKRKSDETDIEILDVTVKKSKTPLIVLDDERKKNLDDEYEHDKDVIPLSMLETAECPICGSKVSKDLINTHVNSHFN